MNNIVNEFQGGAKASLIPIYSFDFSITNRHKRFRKNKTMKKKVRFASKRKTGKAN